MSLLPSCGATLLVISTKVEQYIILASARGPLASAETTVIVSYIHGLSNDIYKYKWFHMLGVHLTMSSPWRYAGESSGGEVSTDLELLGQHISKQYNSRS